MAALNRLEVPVTIGTLVNGVAPKVRLTYELSYDDTFEKMRKWAQSQLHGDWVVLMPDVNAGVELTIWLFVSSTDAQLFRLTWGGYND